MIRYAGFSDLIDRMVVSSPERTALVVREDGDTIRSITWKELADLVERRADALTRGNRGSEAVLADGSLGCVVEVLAAVRAGLQVALVDAFVPNAQLEPLLAAVDADCAWASDPARLAEAERLLAPTCEPAFGAHGILFFTSGTTSLSKPVVLTDESLMASAFNGSSLLPLSSDDTLLCLLPLSHVFGFVCGLLWGLNCGAAVALGRGPRHYIDDLALFNPSAIAVVPKLLGYLVSRDALNDNLKLVLVGAADCSDELLGVVRSRGIRASLGYGLTETSSGVALSTGEDFHAMTICPDDEVSIAGDGEIVIHAPTCLMQGYYRDEKRTTDVIRDGLFHTGDKGYLDSAGLLHVEGRLKDVLVLSGGTKVFLPDYEAAVAQALGESDVAVVLHQGQLMLVCGRVSHEHTDRVIMETIAPALAAYPPGSRIARIGQTGRPLPRTAAGDVERWKILEELEHGNC